MFGISDTRTEHEYPVHKLPRSDCPNASAISSEKRTAKVEMQATIDGCNARRNRILKMAFGLKHCHGFSVAILLWGAWPSLSCSKGRWVLPGAPNPFYGQPPTKPWKPHEPKPSALSRPKVPPLGIHALNSTAAHFAWSIWGLTLMGFLPAHHHRLFPCTTIVVFFF